MVSELFKIERGNLQKISTQSPSKRPSTYRKKKDKKSPFSKELEKGALTALKEMLERQKKNQDTLSAAGPFGFSQSLQEIEAKLAPANKINPSAQIIHLYDKLIDKLIHSHQNGIQETTFFLDGDAFKHSLFNGAKITITEYSSAPKIFNIEFIAKEEGLALFTPHAEELLGILREGHYNFSVNRIDTSLLSENEKHALKKVERDLEKEENKK